MREPHPEESRLVALALDELEEAFAAETAAHLDECERCRSLVGDLRVCLRGYRAAAPTDAPARGLVRLLGAQAEATGAVTRPRAARWRPIAALAAAAVLIGIAFATGFRAGQQTINADTPVPAVRLAHPLPEPPAVVFHAAVAGT